MIILCFIKALVAVMRGDEVFEAEGETFENLTPKSLEDRINWAFLVQSHEEEPGNQQREVLKLFTITFIEVTRIRDVSTIEWNVVERSI